MDRIFSSLLAFSLAAAASAGAMSCGSDESSPSGCVQGQQIGCSCAGGDSGVQVCGASGTYGPCQCEQGDGVVLPDIHLPDSSGDGAPSDGGEPDAGELDGMDAAPSDGEGEDDASSPANPTPGCYRAPGMTEAEAPGLGEAPFPGGSLPGEACTAHEDCLYGLCTSNTVITQGKFAICVKKCGGCGPKSPACSWDDDEEAAISFTCVKQQFNGEFNDHCGFRCAALDECEPLSPDYTSCNSTSAGNKYCGGW